MSAAAAAVVSARPSLTVGGQDRPSLTGGLLRLRVEENVHGLYSCEATFGNWGSSNGSTGFLYFDRQILDFGKDFVVGFGGKTIFTGRVTGLESVFDDSSPPALTVLAGSNRRRAPARPWRRRWERACSSGSTPPP